MSISFFELPGSLKGDRLSHAGTAEPLRVAPPKAVAYLVELTDKDPYSLLAVDTSEVDSAKAACDQLRERGERIDFLLLNAGASGAQPKFNSAGVEITWASTLVGHHTMTMCMLAGGYSARVRASSSQVPREPGATFPV